MIGTATLRLLLARTCTMESTGVDLDRGLCARGMLLGFRTE
jgi:hypothetical protein